MLFRFSVALLTMHKQILLEQHDTISIFKHLKYAVRYTFDVEGLTKVNQLSIIMKILNIFTQVGKYRLLSVT